MLSKEVSFILIMFDTGEGNYGLLRQRQLMSHKHLGRCAGAVANHHNERTINTVCQMTSIAKNMTGGWLPYKGSVA